MASGTGDNAPATLRVGDKLHEFANGLRGDKGTSDGPSGPATINPAEQSGSAPAIGSGGGTGGTEQPKRRGRPPGSGTSAAKAKETVSLTPGSIETLLLSTHLMLAAITKTEELALDKKEAESLALAIAEVQKFYPASRINPKTLAIYNLAQTAGLIYGPRVLAIRLKLAKPKIPNPQRAPTQSAANGASSAAPAFQFDPAAGVAPIGGGLL